MKAIIKPMTVRPSISNACIKSTAWALVTATSFLAGCGGSDGGPDPLAPPTASPTPTVSPEPTPEPTSSPEPTPTATPEPTATPTSSPTATPTPTPTPVDDPELSLVEVFPNLPGLSGLFGLFQAPGDNDHWYALLRGGRIVRFDDNHQASSVEEVLDISGITRSSGEMGLLGLAFHPQYASNGQLFVHYSDDRNDGAGTISRFTFSGSLPISNASEEQVLAVDQPAANHNGGSINFGPDGYLYIGFGDGGGAGDTFGHGQNTASLLGALLRIDVDNNSPYAIPANNPFVGQNGFAPEIYAYGLRNPFRWSFDMENGDIWVGDVGQNAYEEISLVSAGNNLGWPIMEGLHCYGSNSCNMNGLTQPVWEYPRASPDCSVTGGYVYRGANLPAIQGDYFYSDFCSGQVHRLWNENGSYQSEKIGDTFGNVAGFGQGHDGEVYVLEFSGAIYQVQ